MAVCFIDLLNNDRAINNPGHNPTIAVSSKKAARTYKIQCATPTPVNQMPIEIIRELTNRKKRVGLSIFNLGFIINLLNYVSKRSINLNNVNVILC